jgi:hypothetical protein
MVEQLEKIADEIKNNAQIKKELGKYRKDMKPLHYKKELPKSVEYGCNCDCVCDCVCDCYCVCDTCYSS